MHLQWACGTSLVQAQYRCCRSEEQSRLGISKDPIGDTITSLEKQDDQPSVPEQQCLSRGLPYLMLMGV